MLFGIAYQKMKCMVTVITHAVLLFQQFDMRFLTSSQSLYKICCGKSSSEQPEDREAVAVMLQHCKLNLRLWAYPYYFLKFLIFGLEFLYWLLTGNYFTCRHRSKGPSCMCDVPKRQFFFVREVIVDTFFGVAMCCNEITFLFLALCSLR